MERVLNPGRLPLYLWLDNLEEGALRQAENLSNHPDLHLHVALMPDAHQGFGMPIGGVAVSETHVIPNAVGVDIGCGMAACSTTITELDRERVKRIVDSVRRAIPLGFNHHAKEQPVNLMPEGALDELPVVKREYKSARKQVGTLGGGNHFIEVQKGSDGHIWLMVHSGSRNIGKQVADHYNNIARSINRSRGASAIPDSWQLPSLHLDSREGTTYLSEMEYCLNFARASRNAMMTVVQSIFLDHLPGARFREIIDVAHNYASRERHYDRDCIVHRKGATRAFADETGIIPGSQGASSYIVRGLGNPESFCSSSHGAGRVMGRKEAVRRLDLEKERGLLEKKGIVHSLHSNRDLDEAGSAYKDIDRVMELQKDLVEIKVKLEPLGVVKG